MGAVLRLPGVLPLFCIACVARLPMGALGLLLILRTHEVTGSFARGGLVAGAYTLALGLSNPALARLVDRSGPDARAAGRGRRLRGRDGDLRAAAGRRARSAC